MSERRAYRISGRVQGVGFRWWARQEADRLGLRGMVQNDPDGTVRLEADGEPGDLDALEARLREGPPGASVSEVRSEAPGGGALPSAFEIVG
jgi:acylphosphatase